MSQGAINNDPINDRVTKVLAFKYTPDPQTADLFLDELALQVYLDRQYITKLESKVEELQSLVESLTLRLLQKDQLRTDIHIKLA